MALVWIALLVEFAVVFSIAAALATWAQHSWTGRVRPRPVGRPAKDRRLADLAPNHRTPCADH
ncbi:hypothetical protein OOZ19_16605 [Saccharopolyspora sp. NFXS83]|uniref:hypothetical protein n=1 Tax=Saccharopolyspora sp. NFXS83 TaxID=2993560 RepID=UPI00224B4663|nr:hypothetical protein [Saccharopolyspora sp. NFXS83]MCX2731864.1 hypothetical protein [Saccharopolyspora sp. NFXS83]